MSDLKKAHYISRLNFEHARKDCEATSVSAQVHKTKRKKRVLKKHAS